MGLSGTLHTMRGAVEGISVRQLSMTYRAPVRGHGVRGSLRALVKRTFREVEAVKDVTFEVEPGEVVGFIGPNGAGKTSTLKMLSGVLHPTGGEATVLGHTPWRRERAFLRQIALIRGSKPFELFGELTVMDVLRFQRLIYEVPEDDFRKYVGELTDLLELEPLKRRQVRALSLGERMRVGFANALVYRPRVLFLDEPTIGLDVTAAGNVRTFIRDYCAQTGATVLLTSHAMNDVESLCKRVVLIDKGSSATTVRCRRSRRGSRRGSCCASPSATAATSTGRTTARSSASTRATRRSASRGGRTRA